LIREKISTGFTWCIPFLKIILEKYILRFIDPAPINAAIKNPPSDKTNIMILKLQHPKRGPKAALLELLLPPVM